MIFYKITYVEVTVENIDNFSLSLSLYSLKHFLHLRERISGPTRAVIQILRSNAILARARAIISRSGWRARAVIKSWTPFWYRRLPNNEIPSGAH